MIPIPLLLSFHHVPVRKNRCNGDSMDASFQMHEELPCTVLNGSLPQFTAAWVPSSTPMGLGGAVILDS